MIAPTFEQHQDGRMQAITDAQIEVLADLTKTMQTEDLWRWPQAQVQQATQAVREGRVTAGAPPGLWHVVGTPDKKTGSIPTYTVTDSCTCSDSQHGPSKFCYHMAAVILAQRLAERTGAAQPTLFATLRTVDERRAAAPEEPIDFHEDWLPPQNTPHAVEAPRSPQEVFISQDVSEVVHDVEAPHGGPGAPEEVSMSASLAPDVQSTPRGEITPEILQKQRGMIKHMLQTLGYKPTSAEEYQGIVLTLTDVILAPENFQEVIAVLQQLIAAKTKPPRPVIPKEDLTTIQGVVTIKFTGLLRLAREQGLRSLTEEWVANEPDLALASATATFDDGRIFKAIGDATPESAARVKLHWRRMAGTRAKARALRDALGIDAPADEEME